MAGDSTQEKSVLRGGTARRDITTEQLDNGLTVNDRLYVRALVLDDGATRLAIVGVDAVAIGEICDIPNDFMPKLRKRIESELGIPGHHVLVNASHTHAPAEAPILCPPPEQLKRVFDAVAEASQRLTPVTIGTGTGHEDRIMMNRRLRLRNGQTWTLRQCYPCPPDEEVEGVGPIDPQIGILRVDRLDGTPLAVVYNFACHGCIGAASGGISANFPGFASETIERVLGNDVTALFLQGAGGDIEEVLYKDYTRPMDSTVIGQMLGQSVLEAHRRIKTGNGRLAVVSETLPLPRRTDMPGLIRSLQQEQSQLLESLRYTALNFKGFMPLYLRHLISPQYPMDDAYRYMQCAAVGDQEPGPMDRRNRVNLDKYMRNIHAMEKLSRIVDDIATLELHQENARRSGSDTIPAEVQAMRIGDFVLITSPGEMLVELGLKVKQRSPHAHTFMAAFSNGYIYYAPPASEYPRGGYEVMECELAPEWEALYLAKADEILRRL